MFCESTNQIKQKGSSRNRSRLELQLRQIKE